MHAGQGSVSSVSGMQMHAGEGSSRTMPVRVPVGSLSTDSQSQSAAVGGAIGRERARRERAAPRLFWLAIVGVLDEARGVVFRVEAAEREEGPERCQALVLR